MGQRCMKKLAWKAKWIQTHHLSLSFNHIFAMYEKKTGRNRIQSVAYFLWEDNSASNKIPRDVIKANFLLHRC